MGVYSVVEGWYTFISLNTFSRAASVACLKALFRMCDRFLYLCNSFFFKCSVDCGQGFANRNVTCTYARGVVDDRLCSHMPKPIKSRHCDSTEGCSWEPGPWRHVCCFFNAYRCFLLHFYIPFLFILNFIIEDPWHHFKICFCLTCWILWQYCCFSFQNTLLTLTNLILYID